MANPFLSETERDIETAIMLEKAIVHDIGNAVAYTDGNKVFINTDDNLFNLLPAYDYKMLKWLLWHERYHKELRHHNRFFRYLHELDEDDTLKEFAVTKEEVNIIMDILVHDSLVKLFPELIATAVNNLAQMRNQNSLGYTFKTFTLEEMLDEYKKEKYPDEDDKSEGKGEKEEDGETKEDKEDDRKSHGEGGDEDDGKKKDKKEDGAPDIKDEAKKPDTLPDKHTETDWSKLDKLDSKEFITEDEGQDIIDAVERLKKKKFRLAKITETLNGLATSTRKRTYSRPSSIQLSGGAILKGSQPGRAQLYLCFDASGSMGRELETFKEIISKSIPQAMECPCEWFTWEYGKGKFKDIMPIRATSGFSDDGDRVIELCYNAEQKGYSPIGITDGGGQISWSKDKLKQLKRTVLVGQNRHWLEAAQRINPKIQILDI